MRAPRASIYSAAAIAAAAVFLAAQTPLPSPVVNSAAGGGGGGATPGGSAGATQYNAGGGSFGGTGPGTAGQFYIGQSSGSALFKALSGDCTASASGATVCTATNGAPFATSATTDTTNASNIASGTLPHARLPALVSGDIPNNAANTSGNAATATALASTPTQCSGVQFATGVAASGNANCATPPGSGTIASTTHLLAGDGAGNAIDSGISTTPTKAWLTNATDSLVGGSATAYNCIGSATWGAVENTRQCLAPAAGTIRNFSMLTLTTQPASGSLTCVVRVNGASPVSGPSITVAASAAAGLFSDIAAAASVSAGQTIGIQCVNSATASSATIGSWAFEVY